MSAILKKSTPEIFIQIISIRLVTLFMGWVAHFYV